MANSLLLTLQLRDVAVVSGAEEQRRQVGYGEDGPRVTESEREFPEARRVRGRLDPGGGGEGSHGGDLESRSPGGSGRFEKIRIRFREQLSERARGRETGKGGKRGCSQWFHLRGAGGWPRLFSPPWSLSHYLGKLDYMAPNDQKFILGKQIGDKCNIIYFYLITF